MSVKQSIKVTNAGLSPILSVAQGTGAIEYEFTVSDFDIPSGSAAVAYNIQPTGNIVSQTCSISGNTITIKPPAYYFLRGKNYMQFQVSRSNEDLFSFLIEVWCAPNISQPEVIVAENPSLVSQLISDVGLLSSRLDNLLSIPEGSTSADAALADIKVGYDGTTYDTPGNAVRGQIRTLENKLAEGIVGGKIEDYYEIINQDISELSSLLTNAWAPDSYFACVNYKNMQSSVIQTLSFMAGREGTLNIYYIHESDVSEITETSKIELIKSIYVTSAGIKDIDVNLYVPSDVILVFKGNAPNFAPGHTLQDQRYYLIQNGQSSGIRNSILGIGLTYYNTDGYIVDLQEKVLGLHKDCENAFDKSIVGVFTSLIPEIELDENAVSINQPIFYFNYFDNYGLHLKSAQIQGIEKSESITGMNNVIYFFCDAVSGKLLLLNQDDADSVNTLYPDSDLYYLGYYSSAVRDIYIPKLIVNGVTYTNYVTQEKEEEPPILKYSILGDSVSTYAGYITSGNAAYYPQEWFTEGVEATWWKRVERKNGLTLEVNNSWSGSYVTNYTGNGTVSMISRCENLGNPDIIFFFGGYNDFSNGSIQLGIFEKKESYLDGNLSVFADAYCYILQKMIAKYPKAKILCFSVPPEKRSGIVGNVDEKNNTYFKSEMNEMIHTICNAFHVTYVDTSAAYSLAGLSVFAGDWDESAGTGLHPNAEGMARIAECVNHALSELLSERE